MNTSRDIEKLFDHFGGNAGDYQEIGRENEAKTARTRWPLLATLDFAQPTIPEIAPRREVQLNSAQSRATEATTGEPANPTPILRGRQPLFTRPHRRTIPPVTPPPAESLSALRFSALNDSASNENGTIPDSAAAAVAPIPAAAPAPAEVKPVANDASAAGQAQPAPGRQAGTFGSSFLARRAPASLAPAASEAAPASAPRTSASAPVPTATRMQSQAPTQPQPPSQSILGKLFKSQPASTAASAPADSLETVFERLRHAGPQAAQPTNTHAVRASRPSRS